MPYHPIIVIRERSLGLEITARRLAGVGEEVVGFAEGLRSHNEVPRDLVALQMA